MTPTEAAAARPRRKYRPRGSADAAEQRRLALARSTAAGRAKVALVALHKDEYDALYRAACDELNA